MVGKGSVSKIVLVGNIRSIVLMIFRVVNIVPSLTVDSSRSEFRYLL